MKEVAEGRQAPSQDPAATLDSVQLREALQEVLPRLDFKETSVGACRRRLSAHLGLPEEALDSRREEIRSLTEQVMKEIDDRRQEDKDESEDEDDTENEMKRIMSGGKLDSAEDIAMAVDEDFNLIMGRGFLAQSVPALDPGDDRTHQLDRQAPHARVPRRHRAGDQPRLDCRDGRLARGAHALRGKGGPPDL